MFALEISFHDGASQSEMLFVRRPQSLIGSADYAHVVVDDMKALGYQLRIVRDIGRRFVCKSIGAPEGVPIPAELDSAYEGEAALSAGGARFYITALDFDLSVKDAEPPDKAGVRIMRRACSSRGPMLPALVVHGNPPMVISFVPDQPIFIGRSKLCALRLDSADISGKHARIGYESGEFWIEDLGSTNGTYVNRQQISGRVSVPPGTPIVLGREVTLTGVTSEEQIVREQEKTPEPESPQPVEEEQQQHHHQRPERESAEPELARYPVLFSVSEVARPARMLISHGATITLGREPGCGIWLGAPHISRQHCTVSLGMDGRVRVTDTSTNGTAYDEGSLISGETVDLGSSPRVLDFGGSVTVAICFNEDQERAFVMANGATDTFVPDIARRSAPAEQLSEPQSMIGEVAHERMRFTPLALLIWLSEEFRRRSLMGKVLMVAMVSAITMVVIVLAGLLLPMISKP